MGRRAFRLDRRSGVAGREDRQQVGAVAADGLGRGVEQLEGDVEGMRVGPYRVLSELGHGGMGAVYLAVRDPASFTHKVALKLIKRGMDTDEIVRRFVAERQILASLAHPNIARLFDGGSTVDQILDISGMTRLDALRIMYQLLDQRVISLG